MPDTSHFYDERSTGILEGAKRAFSEIGFDGASMQDLARAAGMSAGNFYRYFPSKDAIVAAMIGRDLAEVKADFARLLASPDPADALYKAFEVRLENRDCSDGPLWAEIEAAAQRKPEIAALVNAMEDEVCTYLARAMAHISGREPAEAQALYAGHAGFLILMFKMASQHLHTGKKGTCAEITKKVHSLVLATIRQTISELTGPAPSNKEY